MGYGDIVVSVCGVYVLVLYLFEDVFVISLSDSFFFFKNGMVFFNFCMILYALCIDKDCFCNKMQFFF